MENLTILTEEVYFNVRNKRNRLRDQFDTGAKKPHLLPLINKLDRNLAVYEAAHPEAKRNYQNLIKI